MDQGLQRIRGASAAARLQGSIIGAEVAHWQSVYDAHRRFLMRKASVSRRVWDVDNGALVGPLECSVVRVAAAAAAALPWQRCCRGGGGCRSPDSWPCTDHAQISLFHSPTPPKCSTRAILALINNLGIVYHQYCSSSIPFRHKYFCIIARLRERMNDPREAFPELVDRPFWSAFNSRVVHCG